MAVKVTYEDVGVVIPFLMKVLLSTNTSKPMFGKDIVTLVNDKLELNEVFNQFKLRICINYMRKTEMLPIISGSRGYWVSYNVEEMVINAESLESRANAILHASNGMRSMIKKIVKLQKKHSKMRDENKKYDF
jgi:hypothetical protein